MQRQDSGTSCGINATRYLLGCYEKRNNIFSPSNLENDFRDVSNMECLSLINEDEFRIHLADFIDEMCRNNARFASKAGNKEGEDSEMEIPVSHPGDSPFRNEWEASVYNLPTLSVSGLSDDKRKRKRINRKIKNTSQKGISDRGQKLNSNKSLNKKGDQKS